jgi:hypothetical protein
VETTLNQNSPKMISKDPLDGWWIDPIPPVLHDQARKAVANRNVDLLLFSAGNRWGLPLVAHNIEPLRRLGLYEETLLRALVGSPLGSRNCGSSTLKFLFRMADRARFRAAGEPLPGSGPFVLYRGVTGRGSARVVRGVSWTASLERAKWFARRFEWLADPAVYRVTAPEEWVLAYTDERKEQEFLLQLPAEAKVERVWRASSAVEPDVHAT